MLVTKRLMAKLHIKAGIDFAAVGWGYTSAEKLKLFSPKSCSQTWQP